MDMKSLIKKVMFFWMQILIATGLHINTSHAESTLEGKSITTAYYWPNKSKIGFKGEPITSLVGPEVEIARSPQGFPIASIDFKDTAIELTFNRTIPATPSPFNGWRFYDADNSLPNITSAALTQGNTGKWDLSFDADNIWLNAGAGVIIKAKTTIQIDISTAPVNKENQTDNSVRTESQNQANSAVKSAPASKQNPLARKALDTMPKVYNHKKNGYRAPMEYKINGYLIGVSSLKGHGGDGNILISFSDQNGKNDHGNFFLEYKGPCQSLMEFKANYLWSHDNKTEYSAYRKSKDIADLPVVNMIRAMQQVIVDQCENVEAIRFYLQGNHSDIRNNPYEGSMSRINGWEIEKGYVLEDNNHYTADASAHIGGGLYYRGELAEQIVEAVFWSERSIPADRDFEDLDLTAIAYLHGNKCFIEGSTSNSQDSIYLSGDRTIVGYTISGIKPCTDTTITTVVLQKRNSTDLELKPFSWKFEGQQPRKRATTFKKYDRSSETMLTLYDAQVSARKIQQEYVESKSKERAKLYAKMDALFEGDQGKRLNQHGLYKRDDLILSHTEFDDPNFSPVLRLQSWLYYGMFDRVEYDEFYAYYFLEFMERYAQICRPFIVDPILYTTRLDEVDRDGWGTEISRKKGETSEILLAKEYLKPYKDATAKYNSTAMLELFNLIINRKYKSIPYWIEEYKDKDDPTIPTFLQNGCMSEPVHTVYKNLLNKSTGKPPLNTATPKEQDTNNKSTYNGVGKTISAPDTPIAKPVLSKAAGRYQTVCSSCHGMGIMGAPKLGDKAEWPSRIAQGLDTLYQHTLEGFNMMPPKGGCTTCSDEDIKAVVDYMVAEGK